MNPTLRERLIRAEQHFLLAVVSNDEESLKVFSQEWSQLPRDIESVKAAGRLDDNTAHLLSKVSQAIENVMICMLESRSILQESLTCSISELIQYTPSDGPSIASLHSQAIAPCRLLFSLPSSTILGQQKLLDSYAYCWLVQNIHDPYPDSMQTQIISDISGTSVTQVELWFQEARDSIGWSKLSQDFFAGSVNATVAAARRVYLERDKNISFDVVFAFTSVKTSAETLFSEYTPLQGKNVDTGSVGTIRTMASQDRHMGSSPGEYIIDSDSILVLPEVGLPAPLGPLSDLSESDESEEEDTTPPPSIAGCKRLLTEDEFTSPADLGRQQKRPRTRSMNRKSYSEPECAPLLPTTLMASSEHTHMSATLVSPSPSLHPLTPTSPRSLPGPPTSIYQRNGRIEHDEDTPEVHTHVLVHGTRKRKVSQCASPVPSKRQRRLSIPSKRHSGTSTAPPSDGYRSRPTNSDEFLQPTLQVPVDSDIPVNLGVFDWKSYPLAGTTSSISQSAVGQFYVPSSDLRSQLLEPPDLGRDAEITVSDVMGSLEELSSLLQLPMPAGHPPDLSTYFAASPHLGDSSLVLQDFDLSSITGSTDLLPPGSTQSSSPLTSSSDLPTPQDNPHELWLPSRSCDAPEQPLSELSSLIPPSTFLPFASGAFPEGVDNMWSLLWGES